jgi:hypothetical protein
MAFSHDGEDFCHYGTGSVDTYWSLRFRSRLGSILQMLHLLAAFDVFEYVVMEHSHRRMLHSFQTFLVLRARYLATTAFGMHQNLPAGMGKNRPTPNQRL